MFKIKIYFICTYVQNGAHKPLSLKIYFIDNNLRYECLLNIISFKITRHSVNIEQWRGKQRIFAIKSFYKHNDSCMSAYRLSIHFYL